MSQHAKNGEIQEAEGAIMRSHEAQSLASPHPACSNSLHSPQLFLFLLFTFFSDLFILLLCFKHNL